MKSRKKKEPSFALRVATAGVLACAQLPADPGLVHRQEAEEALAVGAPGKAVAAYRLALAAVPGDLRAWRGLLRAQLAARDGEAALETADALAAVDPEPVDPCPALALVVAARLERGRDAQAPAERSVEAGCAGSGRQLAGVLARRSRAAADRQDREAAIAQIQRAIELDPGRAEYFLAAGELLLAAGRIPEAVSLLSTGLEHHPRDRSLRALMVQALSIR